MNAALHRPEAIGGIILYAGAAFTGANFMAAASAAIGRFVDQHKGTPAAYGVPQAWASIPTMCSDADYTAAMRQLLPAYFSDYRRLPTVVAQLQDTLGATPLIGDAEPFDVRERLRR